MKINKQAVLDKINAYYDDVAQRILARETKRQERWDQWYDQQVDRTGGLARVLHDLARRVENGEMLTRDEIAQAVADLAYNREIPYAERSRRQQPEPLFGSLGYFPVDRPTVRSLEEIAADVRAHGRFTDLLGVLENMVGDEVAVSSLQKLGVLDAEDARLLFKASRQPVSA